jgi:hypothetical protein
VEEPDELHVVDVPSKAVKLLGAIVLLPGNFLQGAAVFVYCFMGL